MESNASLAIKLALKGRDILTMGEAIDERWVQPIDV